MRTVAQQKDYMKRVRGNGGSRSALRAEGILIMGDYASHQRIASELGVPVPREGEFVSARVVTANARHASSTTGGSGRCGLGTRRAGRSARAGPAAAEDE